jgi:hypothetical protein
MVFEELSNFNKKHPNIYIRWLSSFVSEKKLSELVLWCLIFLYKNSDIFYIKTIKFKYSDRVNGSNSSFDTFDMKFSISCIFKHKDYSEEPDINEPHWEDDMLSIENFKDNVVVFEFELYDNTTLIRVNIFDKRYKDYHVSEKLKKLSLNNLESYLFDSNNIIIENRSVSTLEFLLYMINFENPRILILEFLSISKKDGNLHKIFNNHYWIRELFENIDPENVTSNFEYSMEKIIKENEIDDNILKQCIINKDIFFFDLNYTPSFI